MFAGKLARHIPELLPLTPISSQPLSPQRAVDPAPSLTHRLPPEMRHRCISPTMSFYPQYVRLRGRHARVGVREMDRGTTPPLDPHPQVAIGTLWEAAQHAGGGGTAVVWTCRAAKAKSRQKREIVDTLRTLLSDLTPCPPKIGHFLLHGGRRTRADKSCRRLRGSSVVTVGSGPAKVGLRRDSGRGGGETGRANSVRLSTLPPP